MLTQQHKAEDHMYCHIRVMCPTDQGNTTELEVLLPHPQGQGVVRRSSRQLLAIVFYLRVCLVSCMWKGPLQHEMMPLPSEVYR